MVGLYLQQSITYRDPNPVVVAMKEAQYMAWRAVVKFLRSKLKTNAGTDCENMS